MARILPDHEIEKLLDSVLIDAQKEYINPNGIELRLGKQVRFHSTGERKDLDSGLFLKVSPGETVIFSSLETIDFTADSVQAIFPDSMLMGLITPTTTMMREGISQTTTKIDAGFRGTLNWALRNGSTKELIIEYGEPIFKLTIFLLEADEVPEVPYGAREKDKYMDSDGVVSSARRIPADISKNKLISSSFDKVDPKKQLREAGYPFDHIGTELTALHGKFEVVSHDVAVLKEQFEKQTSELSAKIEKETGTLTTKLAELRDWVVDRVDAIFTQKFTWMIGITIAALTAITIGIGVLQEQRLSRGTFLLIGSVGVILILGITFVLTRRSKKEGKKEE